VKDAGRGALVAALALLVLVSSPVAPAWSSATTQDNPAAPDTATTLYQVRDGDASYVAPTNGYDDDGVTDYCLLTQDAAKAALTSVRAPNGNTYPLTSVYVGNALSVAAGCLSANKTLFVDSGTYNSDLDYYALTWQNFSLVGLGSGGGDPGVTLVRTFSTSSPPDGTVDRYQFSNATDIYLGNLILDFAGKNLRNNSSFGKYAINVGVGTDGFVMEDVVIQNVGLKNTAAVPNSALNIVYANTGTHHFVDLTVRNVKTTSSAGVVFTNQSTGVYFYNLSVDASQAASASNGVRIENADTSQLPLTANMVVFAGDTEVSTGFIQVQDYRYDLIAIPADYRYIQYTTSNANGTTGAYRAYKTLPAAASNKAILDRADGYWVVRQGQARTVTQQLADIVAVRGVVASALSSTPARIPAANIKLAVSSPAEVASFTVANFGAGVPVNLVAVPTVTALGTGTDGVPVAAGFSASLGSTANSANVALYNFDFAAIAHYTLTEAIAGIKAAALTATDPRDGSYPHGLNLADYAPASNVAAKISASSPVASSQLRNATFVALASGEPGSVTALDLAIAKSPIGLDTTTTAVATLPAWYTAATAPAGAGAVGVDDPAVAYFSSDPAIATVDPDTGLVTGVGIGTATIYAKAKDSLNNGEIEKPYGSTTVRVSSEPHLTLVTSADPLTGDVSGTEVDYHFLVTNTGNVRLTGVALSNPTASGLNCPGTALDPAESMQCSTNYTVTQGDVDAGYVLNDATVSGSPRIGDPVTATDSLEVSIPTRAAIAISAGTAHFPPGLPSPLEYDFDVTNSGNVTLTNVTISDPLLTSASCPQTVLVPGQTMSCVAVYALPQSVIDAGHADLNLNASGTAPGGGGVTTTAQDVVAIPAATEIELKRTVTTHVFVATDRGSVAPTGEAAKASVVPAVSPGGTVDNNTAGGDVVTDFESDRVVLLPFSLWMLFIASVRRWLVSRRG
jgi:hypothetical protein